MNWDALGAIAELVGALAVVFTLVYLAFQVRYAKNATLDQNRLTRSTAIREILLATANNDDLRVSQMKNWGMEQYYESLAKELGITSVEASRNEWANAAYFWMYWGQWNSTHTLQDKLELEHVITKLYSLPGVRHSWDVSPLGKVFMDDKFVEFVDGVLARHSI
ncbi:MAG: hypothetical protein P8Y92_10640 [Halioglobus sp.]|jgi:hypothetical protein